MLLKLATRNIRRSVRDYAIYFVTLLFGVAVFYAFNSIGSQSSLFELESEASRRMFEWTQTFMGMFSILVAFVLGFLVIYANGVLVRRRKREFGTYLTLGMTAGQVSRVILYETMLVGLVSLVVGLVIGYLISQALSFCTASLMGAVMRGFHMVFSFQALLATVICFMLVFVVVSVFNMMSVRKHKLVDLLSAHAKSQKVAVRNPWICLAVFIASLIIIAISYFELGENGFIEIDDQFALATVLMLIGSLLFFWSLAGFVIAVLTRARGIYLRGLVPFTTRQIASKVNTAFLSLWFICMMLFFGITTFSIGLTLVDLFTGAVEETNPYDVTIRADTYNSSEDVPDDESRVATKERSDRLAVMFPVAFANGQAYGWDMEAMLSEGIPNWDDLVRSAVQIDKWKAPDVTYSQIIGETSVTTGLEGSDIQVLNGNLEIIAASKYNQLKEQMGKEPVNISSDEFLLLNNMPISQEFAEEIVGNQLDVDVAGHVLHSNGQLEDTQLNNTAIASTGLILVVPDSVVDELRNGGGLPYTSFLNIAFVDESAEGDKAFEQAINEYLTEDFVAYSDIWPVSSVVSRSEMIDQGNGLRVLIVYLAVYIGFMLLVATGAILAVQQLSQIADSSGRYRILSRLGCDGQMLSRSLFAQVFVYFLVPLLLAVCHVACVINVLSVSLYNSLSIDIAGSIAASAVFTVIIYGGYMLVTFLGGKSSLKSYSK